MDDPTGEVEAFGLTCTEAAAAYGCDFDVSLLDPSKPRGTLLAQACPVTCDSCKVFKRAVSLIFSFYSHYFGAPSEHFLRKELSQIFVPIPDGEN
jgi:hypothetical protein